MKKSIIYLFQAATFICMHLIASDTYGQRDTVTHINDIEVIKTFKPVLSDAIKIPVNPNPEIPVIPKPEVHLVPVDYILETQPTIYTIKPLSAGTAILPRLKTNYSRLGYGNYNTPYAEFNLNTTRNKTWNSGLYLQHFSSNPIEDNEKLRQFSQNQIQGYTRYYLPKATVSGMLQYQRNGYNLYGLADSIRTKLKDNAAYEILYHNIEAKAAFESTIKDSGAINYKCNLSYFMFMNPYNISEQNINLAAHFSKMHEGVFYEIKSSFNSDHTRFGTGDYTYTRNIFQLAPHATLSNDNYNLHAAMNFMFMGDSSGSSQEHFAMLPTFEAEYYVIPGKLSFMGGLRSQFIQNTFRSIAQENPFLISSKDSSTAALIKALPISNTRNKVEFFIGFKSCIGNANNLEASVSIANYSQMMFYQLAPNNLYQTPIYDEGNLTLTKYSAAYFRQFSEKFRLGMSAKYYNYSMGKLDNPFGRSNMEAMFQAAYNLQQKITLRTDVFYLGERTFKNENGMKETANPISDINIALDYRYSKTVSAFINCNNISNNQYKRWMNYPVYGFNALAGLTITF